MTTAIWQFGKGKFVTTVEGSVVARNSVREEGGCVGEAQGHLKG